MATKPTPTKSKASQAAQHQNRAAPAQRTATPQRTSAPPRQAPQPPARRPAPVPMELEDTNLPAFMRSYGDAGKENIDREDLETPRLKLMQGLSPELQLYDGLRPGHFFHSAAEHIFDGPFVAVPLYLEKRFILWRPRDQGGGILARADDGVHWSPADTEFVVQLDKKDGGKTVTWRTAQTVVESGLNLWGTMNPDDPNSPPAATQMYNFVLAFPEYPELMPAVLSFQRSSIRMARKYITKIRTQRGPLFGRKYTFSAFVDHNKAGQEFYNVNIASAGLVEDEAQFDEYATLHESFKGAGLKVKDIESLQDEAVGDEVIDETSAPSGARRY